MKLPDANLLLYAFNRADRRHVRARDWLNDTLSSDETVAFAWMVLLGFVRMSTSARIFPNPLPPHVALDEVDLWLSRSNTLVVHPGPRHAETLRALLDTIGTAGNLTMDAHLAALAIEHGADLCSSDNDFARFAGVRWVNPLA